MIANNQLDIFSRSLSENGHTFFEFKNKEESLVSLQFFHNKGLGLMINDARKNGSLIMHTDAPVSILCLPSKLRMEADNCPIRQCPVCYHVPAKRAFKSSEDFAGNDLLCSKECLQWYDHYYSCCGKMLDLIISLKRNGPGGQKNYADSHSLLLRYLYITTLLQQQPSPSAANDSMIIQLQNVFDLFQPTEVNTEVLEQSTWFHRNAAQFAPALFAKLPSQWVRDGDYFYKLIHVFRYNAQPLLVQGLQRSSEILCILPSLARLNHSCAPNCRLLFQLIKRRSATGPQAARVRVILQAIRDIEAGEELTISYLQSAFHKPALRQKLLQESFRFSCQCKRCITETESISKSQSQGILEAILHHAESGENVLEEVFSSLPRILTCCRRLVSECKDGVCPPGATSKQSAAYPYDAHDVALLLLSPAANAGDNAQRMGALEAAALRASCAIILCDCLYLGGVSGCDDHQRYALLGAQSVIQLLAPGRAQLFRPSIAMLCPEGKVEHLVAQVRSHLNRALIELQLLSTVGALDCEGDGKDDSQEGRVDISSDKYYQKLLLQGTKLRQQLEEIVK